MVVMVRETFLAQKQNILNFLKLQVHLPLTKKKPKKKQDLCEPKIQNTLQNSFFRMKANFSLQAGHVCVAQDSIKTIKSALHERSSKMEGSKSRINANRDRRKIKAGNKIN